MHIFKYSRRKGTKADKMSGQVDEALKSSRSSKLLELNKKMSIEYMESYIGKEVTALMEESILIDNEKYYRGYSKEYIMVCVKCDDDLSNKIIKGRGVSIQNNLLLVEKM
jgi:threonylcarbamoyladenosine tRNA methylthiotransferase MtaB